MHAAQINLIPHNPTAKVDAFYAYVGALFKQEGYEAVEEWFSPVVEEAIAEILSMELAANLEDVGLEDTSTGMPPAPSGGSQSPPSRSNSFRANASAANPSTDSNALATFNQICSQKHIVPVWEIVKEGPDHAARFTVTLKCKDRRCTMIQRN